MTSVLITRPLSVSQPLATALQKLDFETVIEPLLKIVPWPIPRPKKQVAAIMITSGAVFQALEGRRREIANLFSIPCFCVGPRTAEKAKDFGFHNISYSSSDGTELAKLVVKTPDERNSVILHICARDIDSKAQDALLEAGRKIVPWPIYEAIPISALSAELTELLKNGKIDAVVVFSSRSAKTLNALIAKHKLEACCSELTAICLSDAIAANFASQAWRKIIAAPQPNEDAVIACLQAACPVKK